MAPYRLDDLQVVATSQKAFSFNYYLHKRQVGKRELNHGSVDSIPWLVVEGIRIVLDRIFMDSILQGH